MLFSRTRTRTQFRKLFSKSVWAMMAVAALSGASAQAKIGGKIVLGFSQIGAESDWRVANTKSIKDAAAQNGIILVFSDAQQRQENQIKALKTFILQKVDVIAFSPVVSKGWHEVLTQAKNAGIPVIVVDRDIDEKDRNLYVSKIGSDFLEEGKRAAKCLVDLETSRNLTGQINIVELRGTEGSAPALQRKQGFDRAIKDYPNFKVIRSENGDFKEALGKELMEKIIREEKAKGRKIDALFAHNDNMALGAIPAMEASGIKPGKDIAIVSIDGILSAFKAMASGKINCTVECSPLLGPQLMTAVHDLVDGKSLPRQIMTVDGVFPASKAEQELPNRKY